MTKVLVIAPHLDDEVLGCGMAICHHVKSGGQVDVLVLADRPQRSLAEELDAAQAAQKLLGYQRLYLGDDRNSPPLWPDRRLHEDLPGLISTLEYRLNQICPDICYVPHCGDTNQDHRTTFLAAEVALRPHGAYRTCRAVHCYEIPSGTEGAWQAQGMPFVPNAFVSGSAYLERKLAAWACYPLQQRPLPNPRAADNVRALAQYRGARFGVAAAEAFATQFLEL